MQLHSAATWSGALILGATILHGCAQPPVTLQPLEAPRVEPEPLIAQDPTLLERFQEVSRLWECEAARARQLESDLAQERERSAALRKELDQSQAECQSLQAKAAALAELQTKYDEAQREMSALTDALRDARRELLQEKLARVKQEQALVSLKIAAAQEQRKRLISGAADASDVTAAEGEKR